MRKKIIIIGSLCIVAALIIAAAPRGVTKFYNLAVYGAVTGGDNWRRHAHGNGGTDVDDTITTTGTSSTSVAVAGWSGQTTGTIPLTALCGTDYTIITCKDADTALFRTSGYQVIIVK